MSADTSARPASSGAALPTEVERLRDLAERVLSAKAEAQAVANDREKSDDEYDRACAMVQWHARRLGCALEPEVILALLADAERYRTALRTITRREGRYSRDPLTHAANTITDMACVAEDALAGTLTERSDA